MIARGLVRAIKAPIVQLRNRGAAIILMYHRVGEPGDDPWALAVTPAHFEEHLRVLSRVREVVPLTELAMRVVQGKTVNRLAALTFDDGYADNLYAAKPLLDKSRMPATVFVTTDGVGARGRYWWDELAWLVPAVARRQATLRVQVGRLWHEWRLDEDAPQQARAMRKWRAWETPITCCQRVYVALWQLLRSSTPAQIEDLLGQLRKIVGDADEGATIFSILSKDELRSLAANDAMEIGAHGVTHVSLRDISSDLCRREIEQAKLTLEEQIDAPIRAFAYPFGEWSDTAVAVLREAGFLCACTTHQRATPRSSDPFKLPRLHVHDWDGHEFERTLATLLPRS